MNAVLLLALGFAAIIVIGTALAAAHDLIATSVARATRPEVATAALHRPDRARSDAAHQSAQLDGGATASARSKMYATAASKPAGRVSRWRAPGIAR